MAASSAEQENGIQAFQIMPLPQPFRPADRQLAKLRLPYAQLRHRLRRRPRRFQHYRADHNPGPGIRCV